MARLALDMSPSVVERLHVLRREDPHSASAAPPPAQRAGAVQQVDDVAAAEVEVGLLRGRIVAEGMSQTGPLQKRERQRRGGEWGRAGGVTQSRGLGRGLFLLTPTTASKRREDVRSWGRWWAEGRDSWEQLL